MWKRRNKDNRREKERAVSTFSFRTKVSITDITPAISIVSQSHLALIKKRQTNRPCENGEAPLLVPISSRSVFHYNNKLSPHLRASPVVLAVDLRPLATLFCSGCQRPVKSLLLRCCWTPLVHGRLPKATLALR